MGALLAFFLSNPLADMSPRFPRLDYLDVGSAYSEPVGNGLLGARAFHRHDLTNVFFRQLRLPLTLSARDCPVGDFIGFVLCLRLPRKMPLCDAGKMAFSAGMRGMVNWGGWRAVRFYTHTMRETILGFPSTNNLPRPCSSRRYGQGKQWSLS